MKVHGERLGQVTKETLVDSKGIFKAWVREGNENFNWKKVFMASVVSDGSGHNGNFYDNFEEAKNEAVKILYEEYERLEKEMEK